MYHTEEKDAETCSYKSERSKTERKKRNDEAWMNVWNVIRGIFDMLPWYFPLHEFLTHILLLIQSRSSR